MNIRQEIYKIGDIIPAKGEGTRAYSRVREV